YVSAAVSAVQSEVFHGKRAAFCRPQRCKAAQFGCKRTPHGNLANAAGFRTGLDDYPACCGSPANAAQSRPYLRSVRRSNKTAASAPSNAVKGVTKIIR